MAILLRVAVYLLDGYGVKRADTTLSGGWTVAAFWMKKAEESPGSTGRRCRLTAGEGDLRESATENRPPV